MHQCKECRRRPKQEIADILAMDEVQNFFRRQSRISERNMDRLLTLTKSANGELAGLAGMVLEVAKVAPYKKRRVARLRRQAPELWERLVAFDAKWGYGLLDVYGWSQVEWADEALEFGPPSSLPEDGEYWNLLLQDEDELLDADDGDYDIPF